MQSVYRALLFSSLLVIFPTVVSGQVTDWLIALSGEHAPGTDGTFLRFSNPVINAFGDVAFQADLSGSTTDVVPHGIWAGSRAALRPVAIAGQQAPSTDGARFRTPGWPIVLTADGQTLFYANLVNSVDVTFDNDYGIWAGPSEDLRLLARKSIRRRSTTGDDSLCSCQPSLVWPNGLFSVAPGAGCGPVERVGCLDRTDGEGRIAAIDRARRRNCPICLPARGSSAWERPQ